MTMEDNDTVIADRPVRSPRAPSSEPSLACRDDSSTDEDDISITRKRPRLDSGSRAVRSISADVVLTPSARETTFKMDQTLKEEIRSPTTQPVPPPSKITITLRRQPVDATANQNGTSTVNGASNGTETEDSRHASVDEDDARPVGNGEDGRTTPTAPRSITPKCASESPILVGSSPSIPIEIAELEDVDDDRNATTAIEIEGEDDDLVDRFIEQFPYLNSGNKPINMAKQVTKHLETELDVDKDFLRNMIHWLSTQDNTFRGQRTYWHELFYGHAVLWEHFGTIFYKLFNRGNVLGANYHEDVIRRDIPRLIHLYLDLVSRMVQWDSDVMSRTSVDDTKHNPISTKHLQVVKFLFQDENEFINKGLVDLYHIDGERLRHSMGARFLSNPACGMKMLSRFMALALDRIHINHYFVIAVSNSLKVAAASAILLHSRKSSGNEPPAHRSSDAQHMSEMFYALDVRVREALNKQNDPLPCDTRRDIIPDLGQLLRLTMELDAKLSKQHFDEIVGPTEKLLTIHHPAVAEVVWKIKLMKQYIFTGRMELRVIGAETMQNELVNFFTNHRPNYSQIRTADIPPLFQCVAQVLLDEKIVDFIIGVSSHPQIIMRSGNIIGFLVVTNNFTAEKADLVWQTLINSEDPRVTSAIFNTLQVVTRNLTNAPEDLYLCRKILDNPLPALGGDCLPFLQTFLLKMRDEYVPLCQDAESAKCLLSLCVDLMCRSATTTPSIAATKTIRHEAVCTLEILSGSTPAEVRRSIYTSCAAGIQKSGPDVAALMQAIMIMVKDSPDDILFLAQDLKLIDIAMENLPEFVRRQRETQQPLGRLSAVEDAGVVEEVAYRLDLILHLVNVAPQMAPEVGSLTFWNHLVGPDSLDLSVREFAWKRLAMLVTPNDSDAGQHSFLDHFYDSYLPSVRPEYFTPSYFAFVENVARYKILNEKPSANGADDLLCLPGLEMVWHVMLTALDGTGEESAMRFLAELYLDHNLVQRLSGEALEINHVSLVQRCMKRMDEAYVFLRTGKHVSNEHRDSMDIADQNSMSVAASDKIEFEDKAFRRLISFLLMLLGCIRQRGDLLCSPEPSDKYEFQERTLDDTSWLRDGGECVKILYQACPAGETRPIEHVYMDDLETAKELHERLSLLTGIARFKTIWGGQRLSLLDKPTESLRDLGAHSKSLLLVIEDQSDPMTNHFMIADQAKTLFEREIFRHFDTLYKFMDGKDTVSLSTSELLKSFTPHDSICLLVVKRNETSDIFPPNQPFKALYSLRCLESLLEDQLARKALSEDFVLHGIHLLESLLVQGNLRTTPEEQASCLFLYPKAVPVFLNFLRQLRFPETVPASSPFSNGGHLVERLLEVLQITIENPISGQHLCDCYELLLSVVILCPHAWTVFKDSNVLQDLHYGLLLAFRNTTTRVTIARTVKLKITRFPAESHLDLQELIAFYWSLLDSILPRAIEQPYSSAEFFMIANTMFSLRFRDIPEDSTESVLAILDKNHEEWAHMLLSYKKEDFVGQEVPDYYIAGLSELLTSCYNVLGSVGDRKPLPDLAVGLWTTYLFPSLPMSLDSPLDSIQIPLLDSKTRSHVYRLLRSITVHYDIEEFERLLEWVDEVLFQMGEPTITMLDRSRWLRSSTGYLGLRNLGNTCYMNSLLTQLYMNPGFRALLMSYPLTDRTAQSLLHETQVLFNWMQNSYRKSADPYLLSQNVRTYTGEAINVGEQMDVEEFFNLLFDQWEEQMLSPQAKEAFRSFYGGKVVHQTKSKECDHVSEREDKFLNIQCEVQGKQNLYESLQAFVEGDVMQGDNKYKCESCGGKLVNAVRRTCLKEVPDHLILHLKRFEYDIGLQRRNKINDLFEFPTSIDMSPYTFDHLSNPDAPLEKDVFELVGVLVHKGQAEHGHYISYIRTRPTGADEVAKWLLFDDSDVTEFDPLEIPEACFGGYSDGKGSAAYTTATSVKAYNAYMLFYQRCKPSSDLITQEAPVPWAQTESSEGIGREIMLENASHLRTHCLFGAVHQDFIRILCQELRNIEHEDNPHVFASHMINTVWMHIAKVASRTKELADFEEFISLFCDIVADCEKCSFLVLRWFAANIQELRDMLTKTSVLRVRQSMSSFLLHQMKHLRHSTLLYGIDTESETLDITVPNTDGALVMALEVLRQIAIHETHWQWKGWDEFFGLLSQIANLGRHECWMLLDRGFLAICLEYLLIHHDDGLKQKYSKVVRSFERRTPPHNNLADLLHALLSHANLAVRCHPDQRLMLFDADSKTLPISGEERKLLMTTDNDGFIWFVRLCEKWDAIRENHRRERYIPGEIVKVILRCDPSHSFTSALVQKLFETVRNNIDGTAAFYVEPYLRAAIYFCAGCSDREFNFQVLRSMTYVTASNEGQNGQCLLNFWDELSRLENSKVIDKYPGTTPFYCDAIQRAVKWAPPLLVFPDDQVLRVNTRNVLFRMLTGFPPMADPTAEEPEEVEKMRIACIRQLFDACYMLAVSYLQQGSGRASLAPLVAVMRDSGEYISKLRALGSAADCMQDEMLDLKIMDAFATVSVAFEAAPAVQDDEQLQSALSDEYSEQSDSDDAVL